MDVASGGNNTYTSAGVEGCVAPESQNKQKISNGVLVPCCCFEIKKQNGLKELSLTTKKKVSLIVGNS